MTDKHTLKVMRGLNQCIHRDHIGSCNCPYQICRRDHYFCMKDLQQDALALIIAQDEKIEKMKAQLKWYRNFYYHSEQAKNKME